MAIKYPKYVKGDDNFYHDDWQNAEVIFRSCVLCTREENGPSDSDFYAVCWSEDEQQLVRGEYATTRFAGGGAASVDATEEVRRKARAWLEMWLFKEWPKYNERQSHEIKPDRKVKIVGGHKYPIGVTGTVGVLIPVQFGPRKVTYARLDLDTPGRERVDVNVRKLEVVNPKQYEYTEERGRYFAQLNNTAYHAPFVRSGFVVI
jgi:hypothetical protein